MFSRPPPVPGHSRPGYTTQYQQPPTPPVVGGYYANWTVYAKPPFAPSSSSYYHLNTILYAFAKVAPTGEVTLSDPWGDIEKPFEASLGTPEFDPGFKGNLGEIAILKHRNPTLRCQISVGGAGDETTVNFRKVIRSRDAIQRFASTCAALCDSYALDGIDVDFEHPESTAEGMGLLTLLQEVRGALDALGYRKQRGERYLLSVATSMGQWSAQWLPLRQMNEVLDRVYLMTYDASGSWDPLLGHQAPLHSQNPQGLSVSSTISYYTSQGMPSHKLILGLPLYSRAFVSPTPTIGQPYTRPCGAEEGATGEGTLMYNQLPKGQERWDAHTGTAECWDGREWHSYDNPESVRQKMAFVKERGLGGAFFWELAGGHIGAKPPHPRDLVAVVWQELIGGGW